MKKTYFNLQLLNVLFVTSLVVSNVVTSRLMIIPLGFIIPSGLICYAVSYLITDIIGEIWGKDEAQSTVKLGLICQISATFLILFSINLFRPSDVEYDSKLHEILGFNYVFTIASIISYVASQFCDVIVFHKIRDKFICKYGEDFKKYRWVWNNLSTMTSQIVDTVVYIVVAFGIGLGYLFSSEKLNLLMTMLIGQYIAKWIVALLDTPIFLFLTRKKYL